VMYFHHVPGPFRCRVGSRHATDRQRNGRTDRQTDTGPDFIIRPPYGDRGHNNTNYATEWKLKFEVQKLAKVPWYNHELKLLRQKSSKAFHGAHKSACFVPHESPTQQT